MHAESSPRRRSVSGQIYLKQRAKGPVWYMRVRLPFGGEQRKAIGPAWTSRGRTPDGYFTRRSAQAMLDGRLTDLRRGVGLPTRSKATFRDVAEYWYSTRSHRENWKPATRRDYRSALDCHLLPAFGDLPLEQITARAIERWRAEKTSEAEKTNDDAQNLPARRIGRWEETFGVEVQPGLSARVELDPPRLGVVRAGGGDPVPKRLDHRWTVRLQRRQGPVPDLADPEDRSTHHFA